ncbi:MAG: recombination protein RecR [Candidatus Magasanikbacteria bacterium CG10_big_fil_rev_8_21_14_0_10_36_32]|uniref:Recombination protein RecR n=1 Tax=Candidatus Magasanikbacteria bacterium CG10_big_fil_rev_8_21_14_0_10_36_32 TaxID=1974646 RepID=A0A2M6W5X4_9BACT|nr:MAG: recombination protein RecR [Candidatus Magasanikbacteria bacterium CG10_big_fil_rev_8_21_14_0_10_36_32]
MYPQTINKLIDCLKKLPSVGPRTAERFVFHWLMSGKKEVNDLREALSHMLTNIKSCKTCWNFSDISPCAICQDKKRNTGMICVVSEPPDIQSIEKIDGFHGLYHVLRGQLELDNQEESLNQLKINELKQRITVNKNEIKEIVLALNPDLPGETMMMYLKKELQKLRPDLKITRLARGLPLGSDLQYADDITLTSAWQNRKEM